MNNNTQDNEKQTSDTITLDILPTSFRNEIFEKNIRFFQQSHLNIYNGIVQHKCQHYWLCSSPDGSPNIYDLSTQKPLYSVFNTQELIKSIDTSIGLMNPISRINSAFVGGEDERWKKNNPIQFGMLNKLFEVEHSTFKNHALTPDDLSGLNNITNDYIPLVRVYGIGLGYHITELIRLKNISYMLIYEPHIDLFYTSLFTTPWPLIFKYFKLKNKGLSLLLGDKPDEALQKQSAFVKSKLLPLTTFYYRYKHIENKEIKEFIKKEPQADSTAREQSDAGWYEDQRTGFYLSAKNIVNKKKFFNGRRTKSHFRAFIVGAGPSLNDSIDYLKEHQDKAIIVSCGSAITPLLNAGIIPDYEVVQERVWQFERHEQKHDLNLLKQVTLLKLNVVSTKIDQFYKDTLVFQKFRDPGSSLLESKYPATTAVNPTVTNAGISMCADLGVKEAFLFGVDYGAPIDSDRMHAKNTIYDNEKVDDSVASRTPFELPGNLGSVIKTTPVLSWSHNTTEIKISEFPKVKWFNVGEGARIKGAKPVAPQDMPVNFKKKINKKKLLTEIQHCFDNTYSADAILQRLKHTQMQQVDEYFDALTGFTKSTPQTREEIVGVLSLMYNAVNTGKEEKGYLPSALLPYGFIQLITNVYIQTSLAKDDSQAVEFFHYAMEVLYEYIEEIKADLNKLIESIESEEEIDLIAEW
jgi:hypothetical protein